MLLAVPVALLITWRLLTGPTSHHRDERRAASQTPASATARGYASQARRFEARTLRLCNSPCRAAVKLRNTSFLVNEAPDLPLTGCDRPGACYCEFQRRPDRRVKRDRRYPAEQIVQAADVVPMDAQASASDRRALAERRKRGRPRGDSVYERD